MMKRVALAVAVGAMAPLPASAADPSLPQSAFYVGGHVGYGFGTATATLGDPTGSTTAGGTNPYGSLMGGLQAGYEHFFSSRLMLGFEADVIFANYMDLHQVLSARSTATGSANEQLEYLATLRGRLGWAVDRWTPFLTGGLALASTRYSRTDAVSSNEDATPSNLRLGYVVGAGTDHALDRRWSARVEYLYTYLGLSGMGFASAPARYDTQYDLHRFRIGLNYRFGESAAESKAEESSRGPFSWEIHGQSTFVYQGYPPIRAAYTGPASLPAEGQSRETWSASAFLGVRLWQGGELYFNPELLQGFGVANTTGAGGYPNGEAQKSGFPYPRYNTSRLFLRQEIGRGGEREKVEGDYGQLSGERDVSRVTLQAGKFSVHDIFDNNTYAKDSRTDFLNWSIWAAGAFDYPADRLGLTYGLTAELNERTWAARLGYFLVGNEPNANVVDWNLFARGGYVAELELRFRPNDRPGAARFGSWLTSTFSGSYSDATALAAASPGLTATDTILQTRQGRTKVGFYLNLEQEVSRDVGVFGRVSWNDGRNEIGAFTDIDTSISLGVSLKGESWGRADDRVGLAGAINMISGDHRNYLAAGGLGVLVGDGRLSYAAESIVEAYYALQVVKGVTATADYQLLVNPAYNSDRGPAHVFTGRLGVRF